MNGQPKISIFLSSPADVAPEREAAERVVLRLNGVYAAHVELAAKRWEQHFYKADRGFQEAIAPMEAFDIVVGILWKRIGSELPPDRFSRPNGMPYESGTVYEIETALAASRRSGRPSIYVFKSERPITYTAERVDAERAQKEALDRWWKRTFRDEAGRHVAATNSFGDTEDFEVKFEDCLEGWLRESGHIPDGPVWDVEAQGSPYPGLVAYDPKHSPVFFGRHLAVEHAREELLGAATREDGHPVLFVIGSSGSGKSSLVRAGLVPRLTRPGVVPGVDLWRTTIMVPTADSLFPLAAHLYAPDGLPELAASAQRDPERWARMASGDPEAAADSLAWALDRIGEAEWLRAHADRRIEARLLLVVDQLESLFGTPGQEAFIKVLRALVDGGRVWLLATLRTDCYTELHFIPGLLTLKRAGATYDLPPPGPAEIADIVKGPARAAGLTFAERHGISLARVLVEAAPKADALPLLQMTLAQLFARRQGAELTFAAYEEMAGVEGAIAAYADTVFARIPPAAQRELDPLVCALVRDVARSRSDNQVRFTVRDADRKAFETSEARKQLVEVLVNGRLLVSDGGNVRVAHEALLRRWERARDSLRKLAEAELRKARLQRALAITASVVFLAMAGVIGVSVYWLAGGLPFEAVPERWAYILGRKLPIPALVDVPAGTFNMGSEQSLGEQPIHPVVFSQSISFGKTEVTFREWDACVADGACDRYRPADQWGRGTQPVIQVSWEDVQAYVAWLSQKTGKNCRLPSEAEWEYVARAKTTTQYALPAPDGSNNIANKGLANCDKCGSKWDSKQAAPVGHFPANAWTLHDMHGNVWEWVEDCWHDSYANAPEDGRAWRKENSGNCSYRVLRGGSWLYNRLSARSAYRLRSLPDVRNNYFGFRVVCSPP